MEMGHFQTVPSWGSLVWAPLSSNVTLKPLKGKGDPAGQEALCAGPGHPALPLGCLWPHCVFLRIIELWQHPPFLPQVVPATAGPTFPSLQQKVQGSGPFCKALTKSVRNLWFIGRRHP